jgi:hypothetical protein
MNKFTIVLFSLSTLAHSAFADSFDIIRDGRTYRCEESGPRNPGDAQACADEAYRGPFSREESLRLCAGARSTAPASCANDAYRGPFSKEESINICIGSSSNSPSDCAKRAYAGPFSKDESVRLCSRNGTLAHADCAIKAYAGPYSKEEAIQLCSNNPQLLIKSLDILIQKPGLESLFKNLRK